MPESAAVPPLPNTYWVIPGKLLAGEYPGAPKAAERRERVKRLLDAGVTQFVNLTMEDELPPYDADLPAHVTHVRKPIVDHSIPSDRKQMIDILECVQRALSEGKCVYVHCHAGIGRTGTVVGCLLVERGLSGNEALEELNRLWQQCARSKKWVYVPETDEQIEFVRQWQPATAISSALSASDSPVTLPLRERFLGALLGLAVGDALAAATYGSKPGTFQPITDLVAGNALELPLGAWTDDTAMALCLAESLLERDGFDARDQIERYTRWQREGYLSATGRCIGVTRSTSRALGFAQWRRQVFAGSHDPLQLDPEPLSRIAPVVMYFFSSPAQVLEFAADASRVTCQAPMVLDACRLFSAILLEALAGGSKARILNPPGFVAGAAPNPRIRYLLQGGYRKRRPEQIRAGSTVGEALEAALWAFDRTASFRAAVLLTANLGEQSDVPTAICGALAGAYYGVEAIPPQWCKVLIKKEFIEQLALRLAARFETASAR